LDEKNRRIEQKHVNGTTFIPMAVLLRGQPIPFATFVTRRPEKREVSKPEEDLAEADLLDDDDVIGDITASAPLGFEERPSVFPSKPSLMTTQSDRRHVHHQQRDHRENNKGTKSKKPVLATSMTLMPVVGKRSVAIAYKITRLEIFYTVCFLFIYAAVYQTRNKRSKRRSFVG
jgi:hypothetical protein